jgi:predicted membrane protein|tara:strand:- start:180 stop:440 length:261 start_codon:yes stop_codon:yes gene_type:complete
MFWETSQSAISEMNPWLLAIILLWILFWKGTALWKAARKNSPFWFIALLVINTLGLLEIIYLFVFSEMKFVKKKSPKKKKRKSKKK